MRNETRNVGLATREHFELPMTRQDLADVLGLAPVHVNPVLKALKAGGFIDFRCRTVSLGNSERLLKLGGFDDTSSREP
jgi:CRP-like cAMP-binding protein